MSHRLIDKARRRLASETGGTIHAWGGRLTVALVYPSYYRHAMSNLGFLTVHHLLNQRDDTLCERFFLPDPDDLAEHRKTGYPLVSLESGRPLAEFDLVAFSLGFENDFLNLPLLFELGRLPLWAADRDERHPLLLGGGVCAFLNPEPLAEIFDCFAVGEAEALLGDLMKTLLAGGEEPRRELLKRLSQVPGCYVPALYAVEYRDDGCIAALRALPPAPVRVKRQWLADLDASVCRTFITSPEAEFGDMALTEISRGCSRGCRFCAAGFVFLPPRERRLSVLLPQVEAGLAQHRKQGLVGAAVSDHSELAELGCAILARGGAVSPASLRIDAIDAATAETLARSGHRTATLAPEAGSQRLRDLINKGIDEAQIMTAVRHLAAAGIVNLKLYLLIGLPTETDADMTATVALLQALRAVWVEEGKKRGRLGTITVSVNPFIPKPCTPLQWVGMCDERLLEARLRVLRSAVARLGNVELIAESVRAALVQALFSRGDRRCGRLLPVLAAGKNLRAAAREVGLDPAFYLQRERGADEVLPWEIIDSGVQRSHLRREYERALAGLLSPRCRSGCTRCGACAAAGQAS